jgi:RES domain-containing protein
VGPRTSLLGPAYRVTHPDYRELDTTIEASRTFPGRFNPPGTGAVYVSLDPSTAIEELKRRAAKVKRSLAAFAPRTLFTLDAYLRSVLDLTDVGTRSEWDITLDDLRTENDYTRCHEVAAVARRERYEAIRFPSATGQGENLAVYYDQRLTGSYLVIRSEQLLDLTKL